ncbi:hypothetical protein E3N88_34927 [Mikania micrantha]|uniref:Uncharacterized protein n=1 Tax=Mikania micrantha TaxID=192012 RepID=A0A5N6LZI7_9ASTR|nr:hypothetical protein E3N88_34927 [Mikania micrantha]
MMMMMSLLFMVLIRGGDTFSNQEKSTRIIGVILKAMWNGSWDSWRDVPNEDRTRKGSRPLDKDLNSSSSHVSDVDSEENIEEENLVWVKYDRYLVKKYGDERSNHPKFDEVLWSRATGDKNKRKVYGLSCVNNSNAHGRQNLENKLTKAFENMSDGDNLCIYMTTTIRYDVGFYQNTPLCIKEPTDIVESSFAFSRHEDMM